MRTAWLSRYAALVAACTLWLIISGASFSPNEYRPLYSLGQTHELAGVAVGILMAGLAVWLWLVEDRPWVSRLGWVALSLVITEALLGYQKLPLAPPVRFVHSLLAQLFFSTTVAITVLTSPIGKQDKELAGNKASYIRPLGIATSGLVLVQVGLGTAFRHGAFEIAPHLIGAIVVLIAVVILAMILMQHSEYPRPLHSSVNALMTLVGIQVFLGFAAWTLGLPEIDPSAVIIATVAHTATGALILATSSVTVIQFLRYIHPKVY